VWCGSLTISCVRFMADHDAWRELAETYVSLQM
jgi:hypothetical protein